MGILGPWICRHTGQSESRIRRRLKASLESNGLCAPRFPPPVTDHVARCVTLALPSSEGTTQARSASLQEEGCHPLDVFREASLLGGHALQANGNEVDKETSWEDVEERGRKEGSVGLGVEVQLQVPVS